MQKRVIILFLLAIAVYGGFTLFLVNRLNFEFSFNRLSKLDETKYILYWNQKFSSKTFDFGSMGFEVFKHCPVKNCFATDNRNLILLKDFDAIVMHAPTLKLRNIPPVRQPHQRYIFANQEAPTRYSSKLSQFENFYNWTMTYRADSDIPMGSGYIIENDTNYLPNMKFINNKTKLAAWVVSHCSTDGKREIIVHNLQQFIKVDVYGGCNKISCDNKPGLDCFDFIEQKYKFYFGFENSYCKDYVTEKLYRTLKRNIVPVVYGGADYEKYAPPHSVIVAEKFPTAKHLADYLLFLDKNPDEYLKYFEWKKKYYIDTFQNRTVCQLCKMLHDSMQPRKMYKDIKRWWCGEGNAFCKIYPNLPNISISEHNVAHRNSWLHIFKNLFFK